MLSLNSSNKHTRKGEKKLKTIIFVRGTNEKQQISKCEEYAKANDLEIVGTVNNEKELTVFVLGGNAECVLVAHASRISRRMNEYIETEKMFNRFGVKLIAAGGVSI